MDMCNYADIYAATLGWYVFPVAEGGKQPLIKDWPRAASITHADIARWWAKAPNANIGLSCGPSDVIVIDLDVKNGQNGIASWTRLAEKYGLEDRPPISVTPSGGFHLFYSGPWSDVRNSAGKLGSGIDVRACGGYVLLPPSATALGAYRWRGKQPPSASYEHLPMLPLPIFDLLTAEVVVPMHKAPAIRQLESYVAAALKGEAERVCAAREGCRNETLNISAFRLARFITRGMVDRDTVEQILLYSAMSNGLGKDEAIKTIRSGLTGGMNKYGN